VIRQISPGIQPKPGVSLYSWPVVASICMPTQIPRKGTARVSTASVTASAMPDRPNNWSRQWGKAPSPGSTTRSARRTASGSEVTMTSPAPTSRAMRSKAFCAECRLPLS
jgi:hypothetical protein